MKVVECPESSESLREKAETNIKEALKILDKLQGRENMIVNFQVVPPERIDVSKMGATKQSIAYTQWGYRLKVYREI